MRNCADDDAGDRKRLSAELLRRLFDLRERDQSQHQRDDSRNRTETTTPARIPARPIIIDASARSLARRAVYAEYDTEAAAGCHGPGIHRRAFVGRDPAAGKRRFAWQPLCFLFVRRLDFVVREFSDPSWDPLAASTPESAACRHPNKSSAMVRRTVFYTAGQYFIPA